MFHAVLLVREASRLLKTKAAQLPDSAPGARLQRIGTGLGAFGSSLERVAVAIERGHHRKSSRTSTGETQRLIDAAMKLVEVEVKLTSRLRKTAIGSRKGRQLYALRELVREYLASSSPENSSESGIHSAGPGHEFGGLA